MIKFKILQKYQQIRFPHCFKLLIDRIKKTTNKLALTKRKAYPQKRLKTI